MQSNIKLSISSRKAMSHSNTYLETPSTKFIAHFKLVYLYIFQGKVNMPPLEKLLHTAMPHPFMCHYILKKCGLKCI